MAAFTNTLRNSFARCDFWRAFWVLMFVGHLPSIGACLARLASEPAIGDVAKLSTLLLSQFFFALKIIDVSWLRVGNSRRAIVTVSLVALLLHADVIRRYAAEDAIVLPAIPAEVATLAATLITALVLTGVALLAAVASAARPSQVHPIALRVGEDAARLRRLPRYARPSGDRAPPL